MVIDTQWTQLLVKKGRLLVDTLEKNEMILLNGRSLSDRMGNFTFEGSMGAGVVDLVWCSFNGLFMLSDLIVYPVVTLSDHFPVMINFQVKYDNSEKTKNKTKKNKQYKLTFDLTKSDSYYLGMYQRKEIYCNYDDCDNLSKNIINTITKVASGLGMR